MRERWQDQVRELREARPRHVLFLCVANAARSQMAEGIARSLAPEGVRVSSAGALSSRVHPWAIEALEEIGIDIRHHVSECVSDVDLDSVDAVITLCADEVCPAFERPVVRVHWPMPDPAARGLATFREARDELQRRLGALFAP